MRHLTLALPVAALITVAAQAPLDAQLPRAAQDSGPEQPAACVAGRFPNLGLTPAGDSVAAVQRSTGRRFQVDTTSFVMAMGRGAHGHWPLGRDALLAFGLQPARPLTGPAVLVAGVPDDAIRPFGDLPLAGAVVIQVARAAELGERILPLVSRAAAAGAKAWIVVTDLPGPRFAAMARRSMDEQDESACDASTISIYIVRDSAATEVLRAAGEDVAALLAPGAAPAVRALPGFTATVVVRRRVVADSSGNP